jgi:uncharacterized protein YdeI (YjbR/CyaY-like superfamily)
MGTRDPRVTAYIARQQTFAKPILTYLREVFHEGCPEVEETLKWNSPSFEYKGILGGFAGFKQHAVFGFWKHELVVGKPREGMGVRVTSLDELPPRRELIGYVKKAAELNAKGVKVRMNGAPKKKKPMRMPPQLKAALAKNKRARATYEGFSPSHQREYLEWITDAKGEDTRARRIAQAIEWMAEGKARNWKYM